MSEQPKAIGFYANEGSLSSGNNLERSVPLKAAGTTNHAAVAHAIPINGMTLNKELKDKQMTGIGGGGDPMFAVRSSGQQHAVALAFDTTQVTSPGNYSNPKDGDPCHPLASGAHPPAIATGCMTPELPQRVRVHGIGGTSPTLSSEEGRGHGVPTVLAPDVAQVQWASGGGNMENPTAQALRSGAEHNYQFARVGMAVRRLTPTECERLQGFADGHTRIPWRNKPAEDCPDGPRYKALGNSMAVPCMAWIGKRIAAQEQEPLRYLSVCSGIEAASVAWEPLGWQAAAFAEVEKFPSAVLAHHWPQVPNLGDMTRHESWNLGAINLLVGGTPCQSFSVAGLRKGLRDPRGGLMLTYLEIAQRHRPRWLVWENVPGVLSSHGGRDFGAFLGALGDLGYGWAYRVLDAQWFGVAQRRRRVFVVANAGDGTAAAKVLFESESVRRNPAPSREAGQGVAADVTHSLRSRGYAGSEDGTGRGTPMTVEIAKAIRTPTGGIDREDMHTLIPAMRESGQGYWMETDVAGTIDANMGCSGHANRPAVLGVADVVGTLSDGAHNGGGLNGQDAYTGRIFAVRSQPADGADGQGHQHDAGRGPDADCLPGRGD